MDLVPAGVRDIVVHRRTAGVDTAESPFLDIVADAFLTVGDMAEGWRDRLVRQLHASAFLAA